MLFNVTLCDFVQFITFPFDATVTPPAVEKSRGHNHIFLFHSFSNVRYGMVYRGLIYALKRLEQIFAHNYTQNTIQKQLFIMFSQNSHKKLIFLNCCPTLAQLIK